MACCTGDLVGQARARGAAWESGGAVLDQGPGLAEGDEGRRRKGKKKGKRKKEKKKGKREKEEKKRKNRKRKRRLGEILGKIRGEVKKDFCGFFFWVSQVLALIPGRW
jgi:hypothetical protein